MTATHTFYANELRSGERGVHKLQSVLPVGTLMVDGTRLPYGTTMSESRKRLECKGGCGFTFPVNGWSFFVFRGRRYCWQCAADGKIK